CGEYQAYAKPAKRSGFKADLIKPRINPVIEQWDEYEQEHRIKSLYLSSQYFEFSKTKIDGAVHFCRLQNPFRQVLIPDDPKSQGKEEHGHNTVNGFDTFHFFLIIGAFGHVEPRLALLFLAQVS